MILADEKIGIFPVSPGVFPVDPDEIKNPGPCTRTCVYVLS